MMTTSKRGEPTRSSTLKSTCLYRFIFPSPLARRTEPHDFENHRISNCRRNLTRTLSLTRRIVFKCAEVNVRDRVNYIYPRGGPC